MNKITSKEFGYTKENKKVTSFLIENKNGLKVNILDFGATIQGILVPLKNGKEVDIVLGYDDVKSYENGTCFFGAIVGRYANRIANARFKLNDKEITLEKNNLPSPHHLHGVFPFKIFDSEITKNGVIFKYISPDNEENIPGTLTLNVRYTLDDDNNLIIEYDATSDKDTVLNLTNHTYFNLNGQDGSNVLDHRLKLNSSYVSECDETLAQTGKIISVLGTPLDFRNEETIGKRINEDYYLLHYCNGYDHNMILDGEEGKLKLIGEAKSLKTDIKLEAYTSEPAIQFYTGNYVDCDAVKFGKNGVIYPKNGGFCLEAQHYPDSVNHANFPSTFLKAGEKYYQKTIYKIVF